MPYDCEHIRSYQSCKLTKVIYSYGIPTLHVLSVSLVSISTFNMLTVRRHLSEDNIKLIHIVLYCIVSLIDCTQSYKKLHEFKNFFEQNTNQRKHKEKKR